MLNGLNEKKNLSQTMDGGRRAYGHQFMLEFMNDHGIRPSENSMLRHFRNALDYCPSLLPRGKVKPSYSHICSCRLFEKTVYLHNCKHVLCIMCARSNENCPLCHTHITEFQLIDYSR